ncbi:MAG TPA: tryptophan--tRNA ligase [candidate division Zixibacteria bacterium]|nr:tryptophan--tRNA ligase [candidate division Zixibacteria bacterium]HBZ00180.1 tryptophan--tRNA ligase [candidate division Zixibacteria bacterium]
MQPTGQLHLGNYEGALKNWVSLQDKYQMFLCVVDWHALTSDFNDTAPMQDRIFQTAVDYLAAGLDPAKCAIFVQSDVKEHAELHLLLSMIVPTPWLERVPSYKEKVESLGLDSYGFLGYPLLMAADILLYKANAVPVGKDQLPHIELTREVLRRFNALYGPLFPEPEGLMAEFPVIPGIDGRKMSKSYGNDIRLADSEEDTIKKIKKMLTDPQKIRRGDPGRPEICPVFALHKVYNPGLDEIQAGCTSGALGCVDCKMKLAGYLNESLRPLRERRKELVNNKKYVINILEGGAERARQKAGSTMSQVREAMHLKRPDV